MPCLSDRAAVKAMFRSGGALAKRVHDFNCHPAAYAHPSWFETLVGPQVFTTLRASRRGEARLSQLLLERHNLGNDFWYNFDQRQWRFALLPPELLLMLVDCCGLVFQHRRIAATVGHSERTGIKNQIGEKAYEFALKRAPLIRGHQQKFDQSPWDDMRPFSAFIRQSGTAYFLSHFYEAPTAIAARLTFKFSQDLVVEAANKVARGDGWPLFKRILIHELDPKWQTLFS
jgi:hypothetical protein